MDRTILNYKIASVFQAVKTEKKKKKEQSFQNVAFNSKWEPHDPMFLYRYWLHYL